MCHVKVYGNMTIVLVIVRVTDDCQSKLHVWDMIHQGKSRWHNYHVLVYISPVLTYLLGTTVCTLTM